MHPSNNKVWETSSCKSLCGEGGGTGDDEAVHSLQVHLDVAQRVAALRGPGNTGGKDTKLTKIEIIL